MSFIISLWGGSVKIFSRVRLNCRLPSLAGGLGGRDAFTNPPSQPPVSEAEAERLPCSFPEFIIPLVKCRRKATFDDGPSIIRRMARQEWRGQHTKKSRVFFVSQRYSPHAIYRVFGPGKVRNGFTLSDLYAGGIPRLIPLLDPGR